MELENKKARLLGGPDRLSKLPDSVLLGLLSSLQMKDVVKTGILSKRWKNLWKYVHTLDYGEFHVVCRDGEQYSVAEKVQLQKFVSFIDGTLKQHQSNIKMFSIPKYILIMRSEMRPLVFSWIECVLEKKVEVLEINFGGMNDKPPDCLFQSSSLTKLTLGRFLLRKLSFPVKWSSLKSLCLKYVELSDECLENILLGCPVLESLALEEVHECSNLNITSPSVRKLKLDGGGDFDTIFTLRAPWILELEMSGKLLSDLDIEDLSSLAKATLTCTTDRVPWEGCEEDEESISHQMKLNAIWVDMVLHILDSISHVAELSIGTEVFQVLSLAKFHGLLPSPTFRCKHLTINSPLWNYDVLGILFLLENTPHLETLVINVPRHYQMKHYGDIHILNRTRKLFDDKNIMDMSWANGKLVHLKNVKIDYYQNPCTGSRNYVGWKCNDVEIVGYIMRVSALERLVLCSSSPGCVKVGCSRENCSFKYVHRLSCKLLAKFLPRNEAEEWELKKTKFSYEYRFLNYGPLCSQSASDQDSC